MRKTFLFFALMLFLVSFSSAAVNEYNYFKLGKLDSSDNRENTNINVNGVNVEGFRCSDSACTSSVGNMWGGAFYVSGSGVNLVYPTTKTSAAYGIWFYKDGYVPYWAKGITWYGTGDAPGVKRYLSKINNCVSEVSIDNFHESDGDVSFEVDLLSPKKNNYGSIYVPSSVAPHLKVLVDADAEIRDSYGNLVWSDDDRVSLDYGEDGEVSFSKNNLLPGDYELKVRSGMANEDKCSDYDYDYDTFSFNVYDDDKDDDGYTEDVDCDDYDSSVWRFLNGHVDNDLDLFGVDPALDVCSGNELPHGYTDNNGDCDDSDSNVNPDAVEVCDGIDNDCDGVVDEGCFDDLAVAAYSNVSSGFAPLSVSFECDASGGKLPYEYSWDFGDGSSSSLKNPSHVYSVAGNYDATCKVKDDKGDEVFDSVGLNVLKQKLRVDDFTCFDEVIEGHNQSCSVFVEGEFGVVKGANVDVYYKDGSLFGSCVGDSITGACSVKDFQDDVGMKQVYAIASKDGFLTSDKAWFSYEVLEEEYKIVDLMVFNDSEFLNEDYDFFRGENLYASFAVEDLSGNVVQEDLISKVSLVSSAAGGRIDLDKVMRIGGTYYYRLKPVPITHDFIGDSNVFAFVFDFDNGVGGQEETSLIIRNNLPYVYPSIPNQEIEEGDDFTVDLSGYENDVEDSGDDLTWEVFSFGNKVGVSLSGKILKVTGEDAGTSEIFLRLKDLDGDFDEVSFVVKVNSDNRDDNDKDDDSVDSDTGDWECSEWSSCIDGFLTRSCFDKRGYYNEKERPIELKSCSGVSFYGGESGTILFSEGNVVEEKSSFWSYLVVGILIFLILVLIFLIALIL